MDTMKNMNARELMEKPLYRPVKFRGKEIQNSEWRYGNLVHSDMYDSPTYIVGSMVRTNDGQMSPAFRAQVAPETLGQYLEIKDSAGIEIYEGDIVECYAEESYEMVQVAGIIEYNANNGEYYLQITRHENPFHENPFYDRRYVAVAICCDIEVIGNIHDNPEYAEVDHA